MSELKEKISKGMFWSGVMSVLQQTLGLGFSIVIARRLAPSDFGMVGMLTIFTAIATCLQDGGMVWALTNRKEVSHIQYSSVFWINLIFSISIYTLLFFCAPFIADFFGHKELIWLSRYVFLGIIFSSLGVVQMAYLFKQIKVKERAIATIVGLIVSGLAGIVLAYLGFSYWGIATQGILNIGITTLMLWFYSPFRPSMCLDRNFIQEIVPEGLHFVISNVFAIAGENIFSIVLGKRYSVADVGNFTQAAKWNTAGYSSILGMMRGVSQPVLVQVRDDKEQYLNVFRKLFRMAAFIVVPIMLCLALVSTEFIEIILTSKWLESAHILRVLSLGGVFCVLNAVFTYSIMSLNRTTLYMYLGTIMATMQVIAALIASKWGVTALAYTNSAILFLSFFIYYSFLRQTHSYSIKKLAADVAPIFSIGIFSALLSYYITLGIHSALCLLVVRIVAVFVIYLGLMHIFKCDSYIEVERFVLSKLKAIKRT